MSGATRDRRSRVRRGLGACLSGVLLGCGGPPSPIDYGGPVADWPAYGATSGGESFSPLTQITPQNVAELEVAWVYHTGDVREKAPGRSETTFQATPIVVDGGLYLCTPFNRVIALDPETGAERWTHDPGVDLDAPYQLTCRGVSTWLDPSRRADEPCRRTIYQGTLDARLIALDAATGRPCADFGEAGQVDLGRGLGPSAPNEYAVTSPPVVTRGLVIIGSLVLDNVRADAPGGVVRAFDARTGELRWAWDPVPARADAGSARPESDAAVLYRRGTANAWSILSADEARGLVFVPTGSAAPDYFGGQRGDLDVYASSVVALRAETGEVVWSFQTVHHDLWDYDVASQPALFSFRGAGEARPALLQATKIGHVFWLDRRSGEPIFPVEERAVPQGPVAGETLSPTQPFPTQPAPLHRSRMPPAEAYGLTPWDRGRCREALAALRYEGPFTPPSLQGTLHYPGAAGGMNWGGVAIDAGRRVAVTQMMEVGNSIRLVPRTELDVRIAAGESEAEVYRGLSPQRGTPYALERKAVLSPLGIPCTPPPWGSLLALDLDTGQVRWRRPLGTTRDMAPWPFWIEIGTPMLGGPILTASGLIFIGATTDDFLRALSVETGEELWRGRLPAGGQATPVTYRLGERSRQMVVIAAGGHAVGTRKGDAVVAFALPGTR